MMNRQKRERYISEIIEMVGRGRIDLKRAKCNLCRLPKWRLAKLHARLEKSFQGAKKLCPQSQDH